MNAKPPIRLRTAVRKSRHGRLRRSHPRHQAQTVSEELDTGSTMRMTPTGKSIAPTSGLSCTAPVKATRDAAPRSHRRAAAEKHVQRREQNSRLICILHASYDIHQSMPSSSLLEGNPIHIIFVVAFKTARKGSIPRQRGVVTFAYSGRPELHGLRCIFSRLSQSATERAALV